MMQKDLKFRLYLTEKQQEFLAYQFGAVRFVYNYFLSNRKNEYLNNKKELKDLFGYGTQSDIKQKLGKTISLGDAYESRSSCL